MPYHRVTIRAQGATNSLEVDGKPIMAKRVVVDLYPNKTPLVTIVIEPSAIEFDSVQADLPTTLVEVVDDTTRSEIDWSQELHKNA